MDDSDSDNVEHKRKARKRKQKVILTFNEEERREFLTGFRKRKLQRKEKAKRINEKKEKEKKRQEVNEKRNVMKEKVKKLVADGVLPNENDDSVTLKGQSDTLDFGTHDVIVTSSLDFGSSGLVLGNNEVEKWTDKTEKTTVHNIQDNHAAQKVSKKRKPSVNVRHKSKKSKKFLHHQKRNRNR